MSISDDTLAAPAFTEMALDRAMTERADPTRIAQWVADPGTRAVAASRDGVLMNSGSSPSLVRVPLADEARREPMLLGLEDGAALFALDLDALPSAAVSGLTDRGRIAPLRDAGAVLSRSEGGLGAYLVALLNWHRRHRFCANCGSGTMVAQAGYSRRCPRCDVVHFPRTDPVVIMTVEHQGRLLLGRRSGWPSGRYSVLAGFVSPGESTEEAVVREVREESGVLARDAKFVTSQPWPFPSSLMLGFDADSDGGEPTAADGELEEVGWFAYDAVREATRDRDPRLQLPPSLSIARFLIERWVALRGS